MSKTKKPTGNGSDYQVGYGKPPREHRFRRGRSGNPHGRPKGSLNIATVLAKTLRERVTVTENGRRRSYTKLELAMKQVANKAAAGDPALLRVLIGLTQMVEAQLQEHEMPKTQLAEEDRKVLERFLARAQRVPKGDSDGDA